MKIRYALPAAALTLLLIGCQAEEPAGTASVPQELSAGQSSPPESSPEASTPPETLTPEQLLAQQPIDGTHDAFLVDTGGRLGTLLVTAEMGERGPNPDPEWELWENPVYFSVWNPEDMGVPMQTMDAVVDGLMFGKHETVDANFDGHMDFSYLHIMGNGAGYWYLWVWDEEAGQFVGVPEYREISFPRCDPETGIIDGWARNSGAGDGTTTFHRWENGELVCVRRIKTWWETDEGILTEEEITVFPMHLTVEDRIGGELVQVYSEVLAPDVDYLEESARWRDLDYHGQA